MKRVKTANVALSWVPLFRQRYAGIQDYNEVSVKTCLFYILKSNITCIEIEESFIVCHDQDSEQ